MIILANSVWMISPQRRGRGMGNYSGATAWESPRCHGVSFRYGGKPAVNKTILDKHATAILIHVINNKENHKNK